MIGLPVLNSMRWYKRIPLKWALFGLATMAVCFPYPVRFVQHVWRWRNPNALIEPHAKALEPLVQELQSQIDADLSGPEVLKKVERFVYEKIPYEWDWNTWGNADYLPTVTETIEKGKEDCDGRAVIAASLLRRLGFEAEIVTDFAHCWVKTDHGETMGPGRTKVFVATDDGLQLQTDLLEAIAELFRALAYGIAVFPLPRELLILGVLWLLLLRRGLGGGAGVASLALLVNGLLLVRLASDYRNPILWIQLAALADILAGVTVLLAWPKLRARRLINEPQDAAEPPAAQDQCDTPS